MKRHLILPALASLSLTLACDKESQSEKSDPVKAPVAEKAPAKPQAVPAAPKKNEADQGGDDESLSAQLQARVEKFGNSAPDDVKTKYAAGLQSVIDAQTVDKAIQVGQAAPDFELKNATGQSVKLNELLKKGPVILMWYRGGWCPYCNLTLRAMQKHLAEFQAKGAQLVAISPELPDKTLSTSEKHDLKFQVLSDPQNQVAEKYRVVFELTPDVAELYQEKFQLHEWNGDDSNKLPLAATYVIAPDGKVSWAFLSADYRERAEPAEIVKALDKL